MRAYNKFILCEKVSETLTMKSGLQLTETDMEEIRYQRAKVVEQPGNLVEGIKLGDEIYYDKVYGHEVVFNGRTYTIVNENNVAAVI